MATLQNIKDSRRTFYEYYGIRLDTNLWNHPMGLVLTQNKWVEMMSAPLTPRYLGFDLDTSAIVPVVPGHFGAYQCVAPEKWMKMASCVGEPWAEILVAPLSDHLITAEELHWYDACTGKWKTALGLQFLMAVVLAGFQIPEYARYWYEVLPEEYWVPERIINNTGMDELSHTVSINGVCIMDSYDHPSWPREEFTSCRAPERDDVSWMNLDEGDALFNDMVPTVAVGVEVMKYRSFSVETRFVGVSEVKERDPSVQGRQRQWQYKFEATILPVVTNIVSSRGTEGARFFAEHSQQVKTGFVGESHKDALWTYPHPPKDLRVDTCEQNGVNRYFRFVLSADSYELVIPILWWQENVWIASEYDWEMHLRVLPTRTSGPWCPTALELYRSRHSYYMALYHEGEWEMFLYSRYQGVATTQELLRLAGGAVVLVKYDDVCRLPTVPLARQWGTVGVAISDFLLCPQNNDKAGYSIGGFCPSTLGYFGPSFVPLSRFVYCVDLLCAMAAYPADIWNLIARNVSSTVVHGAPMVKISDKPVQVYGEPCPVMFNLDQKAFAGPSPHTIMYRDNNVANGILKGRYVPYTMESGRVDIMVRPNMYAGYVITTMRKFYLSHMYVVCLESAWRQVQRDVYASFMPAPGVMVGYEIQNAWERLVRASPPLRYMLMYVTMTSGAHVFPVSFLTKYDWKKWDKNWSIAGVIN